LPKVFILFFVSVNVWLFEISFSFKLSFGILDIWVWLTSFSAFAIASLTKLSAACLKSV
jgi:hypothetical protein